MIVTVWKKLQNPYALVAQGFFLGALIVFATQGDSLEAGAPAADDSVAQAAATPVEL